MARRADVRWSLAAFVAVLAVSSVAGRRAVWAQSATVEPGTVGLAVAQLYSEDQPTKRGVLVVRTVAPGSAAADDGIRVGDIIVAVNGTRTAGQDVDSIVRHELRGPTGEAVRVLVARGDEKAVEHVLVRRAFPPRMNPASDAFSYVLPGSWRTEPRYTFPLPWSPELSLHGIEDLAFAPDFDDPSSPEYHSYEFFWWLDGTTPITASQLQAHLDIYFHGLSSDRGQRRGFHPVLSNVSATVQNATAKPASAARPDGQVFEGAVHLYDRDGKVIGLHAEITAYVCRAAAHTAVFAGFSQLPRPARIWSEVDAIRDSFSCRE
jgi:PDZ domain